MTLPSAPQSDLDLSKLDRDTVLSGVDDVVGVLYATSNIKFAVAVMNRFDEFQNIAGFARAKLLWGAQKWFVDTKQKGSFYEKFGVSDTNERTYTDRLIRLWEYIQNGKIPARLYKTRKVRELLPISEALAQGYKLGKNVWDKLEQAVDVIDIGRIIQKAKGKQPRKGTISMVVDSRGFITAWEDGQAHHVGTLNIADFDTDSVVQKAVLRIKANSHIKDDK